jgi:hypothetical protein
VTFVPRWNQGLFDFIKISQDPEVLLFRSPKQLPRLLWKQSASASIRDISGCGGLRLGRLNRYVPAHCQTTSSQGTDNVVVQNLPGTRFSDSFPHLLERFG